MINLNKMAQDSLTVAEKRIANGSTMTKDNLKHAVEELIEAAEARGRYNNDPCATSEDFLDELSDVIICILLEAATYGFNIESALIKCCEKNKKRAEGIGDKL